MRKSDKANVTKLSIAIIFHQTMEIIDQEKIFLAVYETVSLHQLQNILL